MTTDVGRLIADSTVLETAGAGSAGQVPAVLRPAGGRGAGRQPGGGGCDGGRAAAGLAGQPAYPNHPAAGHVTRFFDKNGLMFLAQPRARKIVEPDDRCAAFPGPAGGRPECAGPVLRPVAGGYGASSVGRPTWGRSVRRWPTFDAALRGALDGQAGAAVLGASFCLGPVAGSWVGPIGSCWCSRSSTMARLHPAGRRPRRSVRRQRRTRSSCGAGRPGCGSPAPLHWPTRSSPVPRMARVLGLAGKHADRHRCGWPSQCGAWRLIAADPVRAIQPVCC